MATERHEFTVYIPLKVSIARDEKYEEHLNYVLEELAKSAFSTISGSFSWCKNKCKESQLIVKDLWKS